MKDTLKTFIEMKTNDKREQIIILSLMASSAYLEGHEETSFECYELISDLIDALSEFDD